MSTARQAFGIEELDRDLGGGLSPGTLTVVAGATGVGKTQLGLRWADAGLSCGGTARRRLRPDQSRRFSESRRLCLAPLRLGADRVSPDAHARFRASLGLQPRDRRLFPSHRSRRPPRDAGGPRPRAVARMEDRAGTGPPLRGRLFLPAFRAGHAAGRLRRARAGRAVQRIDPVRVLRVHLPPRAAQGGRMGRAGVVPRAVPRRCRGGAAPPIRSTVNRLPLSLHDAAGHARRADDPADRRRETSSPMPTRSS